VRRRRFIQSKRRFIPSKRRFIRMRRTLGATGVLFASGFLPLPPSGGQGGEKRGDRKRGEGFFQGERESNEGVWKWERREELEGEAKSR
jgi:hypothetical protein